MRNFDEIYAIAAARKGGADGLEALLSKPLPPNALAAIADDRWLSSMARALFQAGFNWRTIDAKWDGFETAFAGFDPARVANWHGEDIDRLLRDRSIVRNGAKIQAVIDNAVWLSQLARTHGSAAQVFADWSDTDFSGLLDMMATQGARLGGVTGQRAMRMMGKDSFVLSADVTARLIAEGIIAKTASSKREMAAIQAAFNEWRVQSGRSLTEISRILAFSLGN